MPRKIIDMKGEKIGRLTVLERAENTKSNKAQWLCLCDCGNKVVIPRSSFIRGTKSCGCLRSDWAKENNRIHGMKKTRLYRIWSGMKDRCCNPNSKYWGRYGGRGICVCDDWKNFIDFYKWSAESGYSENLTLDRIDNDGDYCSENCRWADMNVQNRNKRNNRVFYYHGERKILRDLAVENGISVSGLRKRLKKGISIEEAIETPIKNKRREVEICQTK